MKYFVQTSRAVGKTKLCSEFSKNAITEHHLTVEKNFKESIVRDVHPTPVVLCRQIQLWFGVLFFFFIKIEIKSKYLVMTEKVSTGDKGSELLSSNAC